MSLTHQRAPPHTRGHLQALLHEECLSHPQRTHPGHSLFCPVLWTHCRTLTLSSQIVLQQNLGRLREFIFMINLMKYVNGVHAGAAHNDSKSHNSSYSHGLVLWHNLEVAPNNVLSLSVARLSTKSQDESSVRHKAACTLPA